MEVKQGSSQYWLALLADNTGNPLASVQVETTSGGWINLARANYNYWIAQSGAGSGPFTVRLTDTRGHTVTVRNIALDPGTVQSTGTYMYGAGSTQTCAHPGAIVGRADADADASADLSLGRRNDGVRLGQADQAVALADRAPVRRRDPGGQAQAPASTNRPARHRGTRPTPTDPPTC